MKRAILPVFILVFLAGLMLMGQKHPIGLGNGVSVSGAVTTGHCASFASATSIQDAGACGSGSGTVTSVSGTTNQVSVATGTTTPVISLPSVLILPGTGSKTAPAVVLGSGTKGWYQRQAGDWTFTDGTNAVLEIDPSGSGSAEIQVGMGKGISFSGGGLDAQAIDVGFFRQGVGVMEVSTSNTPNASGKLLAAAFNKMAITAPATSSTLAVADGKTATISNTLTFTGTDGSSVAFGAGGTATMTIASGTSAMGTGAISSATCATVVTTSATGTATTDTIMADFNGDPTAVTGYIPATAGMLTIIKYPTTNNVNFKVCNNTAGSITPGAITLNWRVVR